MINLKEISGDELSFELSRLKERLSGNLSAPNLPGHSLYGHHFYQITFSDEKVGFLWWSDEGERNARLCDLYIEVEKRRQGHGRAALDLLKKHLQEKGKRNLCSDLTVDEKEIYCLYLNLGFRELEKTENKTLFQLGFTPFSDQLRTADH